MKEPKRYIVEVDSLIGPIVLATSGDTFTDAWNRLRSEVVGVTKLRRILEEKILEKPRG